MFPLSLWGSGASAFADGTANAPTKPAPAVCNTERRLHRFSRVIKFSFYGKYQSYHDAVPNVNGAPDICRAFASPSRHGKVSASHAAPEKSSWQPRLGGLPASCADCKLD